MAVDPRDQDARSYEDIDSTHGARRIVLVDSTGARIKMARKKEVQLGSAGSGSDGAAGRVYTLVTSDTVDIQEVFLDGVLLVETSNYTVDNTNKTVTMLGNVFNSQTITVFYYA